MSFEEVTLKNRKEKQAIVLHAIGTKIPGCKQERKTYIHIKYKPLSLSLKYFLSILIMANLDSSAE